MARIYKLSRTGLKLIYKIRHHKGHGIHSPFVYKLVRNVVEEKLPYYAYNDIKTYVQAIGFNEGFKPSKFNRLSFKLVNYFNPSNIVEIGSGNGINSLFITAPSSKINCQCFEPSEQKAINAKILYGDWNRRIKFFANEDSLQLDAIDALFIYLNNIKQIEKVPIDRIVSLIHSQSFIVVKGIRTSKGFHSYWEKLLDLPQRTVALDLFSVGILFFDNSLTRWKYKISY